MREDEKDTLLTGRQIEVLRMTVPSGTDLYEIPQMIFKEADRKKIKIGMDSATVIIRLKTDAPDRIAHRVTSGDISISVDDSGNVTIY
jgi:Tfx family DNA-binding protein